MRVKCRERHVPFIFPLINKSAGIRLIGIGMNAKTVPHHTRSGSPGDDVESSGPRSCLRTASALPQNATRTISGFGVECRLVSPFRSARMLDELIIVSSARDPPNTFFNARVAAPTEKKNLTRALIANKITLGSFEAALCAAHNYEREK